MDLEEFEIISYDDTTAPKRFTPSTALNHLDAQWYVPKSKHARWMDLLGDYAGTELFLIDGDALLQLVLDDPLLSLGRDSSFQILHAVHSLERILDEFLRRSAEFEIVFWEANCHGTVKTGDSRLRVASLSLARSLLIRHLSCLKVPVHEFESLSDRRWLSYEREKKPMFVMTYDGGKGGTEKPKFAIARTLAQRVFLFNLLHRGIAAAFLQTCEFRDSKISSHVYEQRLDQQAVKHFSDSFWEAVALSRTRLDEQLQEQTRHDFQGNSVQEHDWHSCIVSVISSFLSRSLPEHYLELLFVFVAHSVLLQEVSVHERALPAPNLHRDLERVLLQDFLPDLFLVISDAVSLNRFFMDVDGNLFTSLIQFIADQPTDSLAQLVGQVAATHTMEIWSSLKAPNPNFRAFARRFPSPPSTSAIAVQSKPAKTVQILPFDNKVFNLELSSVHIAADIQDDFDLSTTSSAHLDFGSGILFSDTQHWHNHRRPIITSKGKSNKPADKRMALRLLKGDQRFMTMMQRQAGTLTGALGAVLQRTVILPVGTEPNIPPPSKQAKTGASKGKKAGKVTETKVEKLRREITEAKKSEHDTSSKTWWKSQLSALGKLSSHSEKIALLDDLARNKKCQEDPLYVETRLYRIHLLLSSWIEEGSVEHDEEKLASLRDRYTVPIMCITKQIVDRGQLDFAVHATLLPVLNTLGFVEYAKTLTCHPAKEKVEQEYKLAFRIVKLVKGTTQLYPFMHIDEHPVVWQLRLFGEYLDRSMDSEPDPRVSFHPDAWQRKVLDCIDRHESLLVVAPTSAGKTFISFYAMEKVLRESDDGILVYVAPTKALVNQIAAEVYARFSKDLNGRSCWAIHTRDYRIHEPQKCQILITVPEMLSTMLLSPPLARVWTPRIRRIILDEIHCIGLESGTVWESILLLAPCPIIGLSATIGEPEVFNKWLETVQDSHGFKHKFISHPHRYSHLRKFYYSLQSKPRAPFSGLDSHVSSQRSVFLHPISLLSFGPRFIPPDLALEAADTLSLYRAIAECNIPSLDIANLEPSQFFREPGLLRQKDIVHYELALKEVVEALMASSDLNDPSTPFTRVVRKLEDPRIAAAPAVQLNTQPTRGRFRQNLIYMVADLHAQGDLPAILFNFNRTECEIMAQDLVEHLQTSEEKWRESSPAWKQKIRQWEQWKLRSKDRERTAQKEKKRKEDPDDMDPKGAKEHTWESSFDPKDPSPQFSFAGLGKTYTKAEMDDDLGWLKLEPWLFEGLRRGIAVHHDGMNKKYRSAVESLFRQGIIRVVIATRTLALGINAPTKTSVFCGDSPFLTALMYRQCAGRAGRRGYDLLGKVVFYGLAMDRVQRLVLSRLPPLGGGNFPLTSTMCLRLFNVLEGSDYAETAVKAVRSIMRLPQITVGSPVGREQLLHHLRFSIDYLRRSRLLDQQGRPLNLFGMATHLYYTEPSNFALVALLRNGILHKICAQPSTKKAKCDFIRLLSHLFSRRYLPLSYGSDKNIAEIIRKSPSKVVLPPLPDDARKVLVEHDKDVLMVFTSYALAYATQHASKLGPDCQLPLSGRSFSGDSRTAGSPFRRHLKDTAIPVIVRSPFVANSGHGDDFGSVKELARTARRGVHLNEHAIPSLEHIVKPELPVNAYLLDFYMHGLVKALSVANAIRIGDVWYVLDEFMLTLKTIREALQQLLLQASRDAEQESDDEEEVDSGYGTFDMENEENGGGVLEFKRPEKVRDSDWRVYEVVEGATREFEEKFRAMWA